MSIADILFILYTIIGIVLLILVIRKPAYFWPALIVAAVGGGGLYAQNNTYIDEYFIGMILLGIFLAISIHRIHFYKTKQDSLSYLHKLVFLLLIFYMIFQSIRGIIFWQDLAKLRWVIYYTVLGIISFFAFKNSFPFPNKKKLTLLVSGSALLYLTIYFAHGFFTEIFREISRYEVQLEEWSTSAYALFSLVIAIPCAFVLTNQKNIKNQLIGWATILMGILCSFYYDSRIGILVIIGFSVMALLTLKFRKSILIIIILFSIIALFSPLIIDQNFKEKFSEDLNRTVKGVYRWDLKSDIDRKLYIQVGFMSINNNLKNFLFGYGFRTHGIIISPHLKNLYIKNGLPKRAEKVKEDQSTEAFTALLVDTGIFGILLLITNFLFAARQIFVQKKNRYRFMFLLSLFFAFLWLPIINMIDIMLFYLLIMPHGLLWQLNQPENNKKYKEKKTIYGE